MRPIRVLLSAVALIVPIAPAHAEPRPASGSTSTASIYGSRSATLPLPVPLDAMPGVTRDALVKVMKDPTITTVSPSDEFVAQPDVYQWLLDHPDRTAAAWRKIGVGAVEIKPLKDGRFYWKAENGSEVWWQTWAPGPTGRVWYAEGRVKPGPFLPSFPVTAVAVLNHADKPKDKGDATITHQIEVFLRTDSKAAALVTRLLGDSAPKMAQEGSEQLLMFFSGMARYAHDKPEKAKAALAEKGK